MSELRQICAEVMNIKSNSCCSVVATYNCSCGWSVTIKEERKRHILSRLHGKTCPIWKSKGDPTMTTIKMESNHTKTGKLELKQTSHLKLSK